MTYRDLVNRFSTTPVGAWIARQVAARIDPHLYRWSGGRFTSTGPPTIPQLVLTTVGRKSGHPRSVQLGYLADEGGYVVVASNFGRAHHPAWSYNLLAEPRATVEVDGRAETVVAERLDEARTEALWPRLVAAVPQFAVYVTRTDRTLRVFRLRPQ